MAVRRKGGSTVSEHAKTHSINRRRRLIRKGLIILLTVLLVFSATSMIASAVLFRVLFPRKDGLSSLHYTYSEINAEAYPREEFHFRSGDNQLRGCRYSVDNPKGCIVIVNGIFDGVDAHLPEIMFFLDHGWSVVSWDATGIGKSDGRGSIGLQQVKQDLCAYLSCAEVQPNLPLMLYGHSAGAYAALSALSEGFRIDAVVSISGFNSPTEMMLSQAEARVGILADIECPFMLLESWFLFGSDFNGEALTSINSVETPILLIEGSSDDYVTRELGLIQYQGCFRNPNVRCLEIQSTWRNEHATPWLSEAAAEYVCTYSPSDPPNKTLANTLDPNFMNTVLHFFEQAAKTGDLLP